ncbi:hypothetical protein B7R54_09135 [Subtercola boreus]|uniref:SHOCT domain-containing protein n=1 Tax=Subtercola boreus TaxID=120213 RepID=A0A3E0VIA2_9MICO|nr:SHOCT domain-containing protein [Subtercola boreus]RFA09379.1 hypothetical protein B7R54_09135 [Subtercola boreus]TQL53585.1 hypothetical protein FB464_1100 [Subtercola boreus]
MSHYGSGPISFELFLEVLLIVGPVILITTGLPLYLRWRTRRNARNRTVFPGNAFGANVKAVPLARSSPAMTPPNESTVERLERLSSLREQNLLSEEEFIEAKRRILSGL